MRDSLTIVAVTALLEHLLREALARQRGGMLGSVKVSTLPPPRTLDEQEAQINLFLWQVAVQPQLSAGLRQQIVRDQHPTAHALPLELHYLLTITTTQELLTELLLDVALACFEQARTLDQPTLQRMLAMIDESERRLPANIRLKTAAETLDSITITPQFLAIEELSKIWSALQTPLRPSVVYQVRLKGQDSR